MLIKNRYFSSYGSFAYEYILPISSWLFIKFNNAFVFPDPEPPIINILYGWSEIYGHYMLCFIFISIIIKINHLYLLSISHLHTSKAFVVHGYILILSKVFNLLSSLLLSVILLHSSLYTLFSSLLNLCYNFSMISFLNKQSL